jgi:hypothetical protein
VLNVVVGTVVSTVAVVFPSVVGATVSVVALEFVAVGDNATVLLVVSVDGAGAVLLLVAPVVGSGVIVPFVAPVVGVEVVGVVARAVGVGVLVSTAVPFSAPVTLVVGGTSVVLATNVVAEAGLTTGVIEAAVELVSAPVVTVIVEVAAVVTSTAALVELTSVMFPLVVIASNVVKPSEVVVRLGSGILVAAGAQTG